MEKLATNLVRSLAFCISSASIKTRIHFFPSAGITTGPFTVSCQLTLFGKGLERRSVVLDGGRLGQPDGLRLEDAFPTLRGDISGVFGIEIQLSCQQPRINLLSSQAVFELVSPQFSVMYGVTPFQPMSVEADTSDSSGEFSVPAKKRASCGVGIQDALCTTSLVVINGTQDVVKPDVCRIAGGRQVGLQAGTIAPESAIELPLEEALFRDSTPQECSWGLVRADPVYLGSGAPAEGVSYYLMYRDAASKRPISVCSL